MTTEAAIATDLTVSAVIERFPKTLPVLARHGIDVCCGGGRTLAFVAQAHGLDLEALLRELEEAK